jgi:predicted deacylase
VNSFDWLRSPAEGVFHCAVHVGQRVRVGDLAGNLTDLVGEPIAPVRAPVSGVVLFVVTSPAIKKDGLLLAIGALPPG